MIQFFNTAFLDVATPWQLGFQDPATPIIIGIIHFHNHLIFFLVVIAVFVIWLIYKALSLFKTKSTNHHEKTSVSRFTHSTSLEIVWTIIPALLLMLIAGPSFALLYSIDEVIAPSISLKVIGHQWYWSYEYSDYLSSQTEESIKFDSYIVAEDDLSLGSLRLLEVDNRVKLPTNVHIRVLVSAADVLHSWAVPSLGIKIDACPGRLNQVSLFLLRSGVFYGQCSEICGVNHGFMPIVVEGLSEKDYLSWVNLKLHSEDFRIAITGDTEVFHQNKHYEAEFCGNKPIGKGKPIGSIGGDKPIGSGGKDHSDFFPYDSLKHTRFPLEIPRSAWPQNDSEINDYLYLCQHFEWLEKFALNCDLKSEPAPRIFTWDKEKANILQQRLDEYEEINFARRKASGVRPYKFSKPLKVNLQSFYGPNFVYNDKSLCENIKTLIRYYSVADNEHLYLDPRSKTFEEYRSVRLQQLLEIRKIILIWQDLLSKLEKPI